MRDVGKVIDAILEKIPSDQTVIRSGLERVKSNAAFVAPEEMRRVWFGISEVLEASLPPRPETDWQKAIVSILMDTENPAYQLER